MTSIGENLYKKLDEEGFIKYGQAISSEKISELIGVEPEAEGMKFWGPFLELKEYLEVKGYGATSANMPYGSLRILSQEEHSHKAEKEFQKQRRRREKIINMLENLDRSGLDEHEKQKISLIERKLVQAKLAITNVLHEIRIDNYHERKKNYNPYQLE